MYSFEARAEETERDVGAVSTVSACEKTEFEWWCRGCLLLKCMLYGEVIDVGELRVEGRGGEYGRSKREAPMGLIEREEERWEGAGDSIAA
jgi:hypothetical protein